MTRLFSVGYAVRTRFGALWAPLLEFRFFTRMAANLVGHQVRTAYPTRLRILTLAAVLSGTSLAYADTLIPIDAAQAGKLDIRTAQVQVADAVPLLTASARVVVPPGREFMVSTPHAGLVSRVDVAVGDSVVQGQELAQLASAAFLTLQREALQASNEHRLADSLLSRDEKLLTEGAIPKRRWEETRNQHDKQSAGDSEVRQVLTIAGMSRAEVERLIKTQKLSDHLAIKAPMTGMVLEKLITTGQQVDQLAPLFRVADMSRLWLEIDLPPEQVGNVAMGDQVRVKGQALVARISGVGRQVLPTTHSVIARAEFENQPPRAGQALVNGLYPGQTVGVDILRAEAAEKLWRVPASALARHADAAYVFVQTARGFEPRRVESLGQSNGELVLRGPLTVGDAVAVQGVAAIKAKWTEEKEP